MVDVPTGNDVKSSAFGGVQNGLVGGIGQSVGRGILGPGIGTAAGGVLGAAMLDGTDQDIVATLAVVDGLTELTSGAGGGGGGANEQVM